MSAETDEYPSLRFQDIRKKPVSRATHGWTSENSIPHHKQGLQKGGGGGIMIESSPEMKVYKVVMLQYLLAFHLSSTLCGTRIALKPLG